MATIHRTARRAKVGAQVGRSVHRLEAREKVTGRAEYTHVMRVPGMLHAKLFRSTVAHGKIKSVDTSEAKKFPGVLHVVTIDDVRKVIPDPYYGPAFHDQPILADGKVRFVGEPVAAVIAADPHVAEQAAQLIEAEYEEMPAVFDEIEAQTSDVYVHDELRPAGTFADLKHLSGRKNTNTALDYLAARRRRRQGASPRPPMCSSTSSRPRRSCTCRSSRSPRSPTTRTRSVTIWSASQGPSFVRTEIARLLGWPENRVRIKVPYLGSGYGSKLYIKLEALALALSMIARKPVKVALTMEEMFYQITKHPCTFRIKSGVDKDGRMIARKCEVFWNGGAYADIGPRVTQKSGFTAAGPYEIENVAIDSYANYTNVVPAGALRGFGIPQLVWAYESHTDMIARELKIDPVEFRRKNILRNGRPHATGTVIKDAEIEKVLDKVAERMNWSKPFDRGSGPGQARPRPRHRHEGGDLADHLGRDRQRRGRRLVHPLLRHRGHGPGLRHVDGADGRRGAEHPDRADPGGAARHGRHALRHGHARLALAVPHGQRGQARGRGRQGKDRADAPRRRRARGLEPSRRRAVREEVRHAGRQHHRHRHLQAGLCAAGPGHRPDAERDARSGWCRARAPRSRSTPRPAT